MVDFWNFKDFLTVAGHYWPWMLAAAIWGLLLAWSLCASRRLPPPEYRSAEDLLHLG